jgi:membrane protein YqaA with SNARE-associated domain
MHELIRHALHFFGRMGGFGLVGFGILDSSFLFLPLGNDLLLIILTARKPDLFWYYAFMAALGSLIGCTLTDAVSCKLREYVLERMANAQRFNQEYIEKHALWILGAAAPAPLARPVYRVSHRSIGLQMSRWNVLGAVGTGRLVRFFVSPCLPFKRGGTFCESCAAPRLNMR